MPDAVIGTIGFLIGLVLACLLLLLELRFASKGTSIVSKVERPVQAHFRPKGGIIQPPDELTLARQDILKDNQEKGRETPWEDLYGS